MFASVSLVQVELAFQRQDRPRKRGQIIRVISRDFPINASAPVLPSAFDGDVCQIEANLERLWRRNSNIALHADFSVALNSDEMHSCLILTEFSSSTSSVASGQAQPGQRMA